MDNAPVAQPDLLAPWTLETVPACDVGLALLRQFAARSPELYALAEQVHFIDPSAPALGTDPFWQAFENHYRACDNCNEV